MIQCILYLTFHYIQHNEPDSWDAFLARINNIRHYYDVGKFKDYTVDEYFHKKDEFIDCSATEDPFDF